MLTAQRCATPPTPGRCVGGGVPLIGGGEADYGKGVFAREDFARMAEILRGLRDRFQLSLNDRPEMRETYAGFAVEEVETRYSADAKATRLVGELLIGGG